MRRKDRHAGAVSKSVRRSYRRPELTRLGEVSVMTAGGSQRANEDNKGTAKYKKVKP